MSSTVIILIVVLLVILVAFYAFAILMRKKTEDRILALEERKESLFDLPVQEEIDSVKKMHLVGQSQTIFREWNQKWLDLSSNSFADLEEHIFEAEQLHLDEFLRHHLPLIQFVPHYPLQIHEHGKNGMNRLIVQLQKYVLPNQQKNLTKAGL